jgi:hypothetical protein
MDVLHQLSLLLIERETIDRDAFERLLAGESAESVFGEPEPPPAPPAAEGGVKRPAPEVKPRPFPLPGALSQPPPPEGQPG